MSRGMTNAPLTLHLRVVGLWHAYNYGGRTTSSLCFNHIGTWALMRCMKFWTDTLASLPVQSCTVPICKLCSHWQGGLRHHQMSFWNNAWLRAPPQLWHKRSDPTVRLHAQQQQRCWRCPGTGFTFLIPEMLCRKSGPKASFSHIWPYQTGERR